MALHLLKARNARLTCLLPLLGLVGCRSDLLNPSGDVALQQRDLLINSTLLMLLIIVPVMALTVIFAWRYRHNNKAAKYEPDWDHSTQLELVIWAAPLLIIICLGALTWLGTHLLDPYRPISRFAKDQPVPAESTTLQVNVVALDWKWLFIYPEYGIATVNELALPINRPVSLHITASSVMNSLYIPALAGQVYAMPGMETQLHGVLNRAGDSRGFSANYSGAGFSGMNFTMHGLNQAEFEQWLAQARVDSPALTRAAYLQLAQPSEREPVRRYASVDASLFQAILNRCVQANKMCMNEMMAIDARGGLGLNATYNLSRMPTATGSPYKTYVVGLCKPGDSDDVLSAAQPVVPVDLKPLTGAGLTPRWQQHQDTLQAAL
ncbi:MAG: ubiquinol oxidase subunit II [Steroidobacteraceae bacterium]